MSAITDLRKDIDEQKWKLCLVDLRKKIDEDSYQAWFCSVKLESVSGDTLVLSAANRFLCKWINDKYMETLLSIVPETFPTVSRIVISDRTPRTEYKTASVTTKQITTPQPSKHLVNPEVKIHQAKAGVTIDDVIAEVCQHYKVDREQLLSGRKKTGVTWPHQVAAYLAKKLTSHTDEETAERLNYSSIYPAVRNVRKIMVYGPATRKEIEGLEQKLIQKAEARESSVYRKQRVTTSVEHVIATVCKYYGVKSENLFSGSEDEVAIKAAEVSIYLSCICTDSSHMTIAKKSGGCPKHFILSARNKICINMQNDPELLQEIEEIQRRILE